MKLAKKMLILLASLLLVAASAAWAAQTKTTAKKETKPKEAKTATKGKTHQATGTVTSITDTSLVLSHRLRGKQMETTFVLNPETKKEGSLSTGNRVMVHYRMENNQNVATSVKVEEAKAKAEAKPKPKPKEKKPGY